MTREASDDKRSMDMTRADPDKNTGIEDIAHSKKSWPKASSKKDKRSIR